MSTTERDRAIFDAASRLVTFVTLLQVQGEIPDRLFEVADELDELLHARQIEMTKKVETDEMVEIVRSPKLG